MAIRSTTLAALVTALAILGGCSSDSPPSTAETSSTAISSTSSPSASTSTSASNASSGATATVDANTATESEIASALAANGVANAARWAKEVVEYRPYPTDDASFAKLKTNLAKYNPSPATLDGILASLTL